MMFIDFFNIFCFIIFFCYYFYFDLGIFYRVFFIDYGIKCMVMVEVRVVGY